MPHGSGTRIACLGELLLRLGVLIPTRRFGDSLNRPVHSDER